MQDPYKAPSALTPNPYNQLQNAYLEPRQSGLGVASFIIGIFCIVSFVGMLIYVGVTMTNTLSQAGSASSRESEVSAMFATLAFIGLGMILICVLSLVGLILGIVGVAQSDRKRAFSIIGLTLNGLFGLAIIAMMVIGSFSN